MLKFDKLWIWCFVIPFLLDRVTKYAVMYGVIGQQDVTSFLEIYLTYNRGISWGIGSSSSSIQFYLVSILVVFVIGCFAWYVKKYFTHILSVAASWMVLSGAISNVIDRIRFGGVVDFIHVHYGNWSFPVFNVADIFITCGVFLLFYLHMKEDI